MMNIIQAAKGIAKQLDIDVRMLTALEMEDGSGNNWNYCIAGGKWEFIHLENHRWAVWHVKDTKDIFIVEEKDLVKGAKYPNLKFFYDVEDAVDYTSELADEADNFQK